MNETPIAQTSRLILRMFEPGDLEQIGFYADPEVMRFIPGGAENIDRLRDGFPSRLSGMRERWRRFGFGTWAVVLRSADSVIGHCGLKWLPDESDVEVFYLLDKRYWRQGIAAEAAKESIRFGFERANLRRIVAIAMPQNIGSQRVMEKAGMHLDGPARHYGIECVQYSIERGPAAEKGVYPVIQILAIATALAVLTTAFPGQKEYGTQAKVTILQARQIALQAFGGKIVAEELEKEKGGSGLRYSFDIKGSAGLREIGVDAVTGKVLENAVEKGND